MFVQKLSDALINGKDDVDNIISKAKKPVPENQEEWNILVKNLIEEYLKS